MKKVSYLEMVKTLLPADQFEAFTQSYTQPLKKSIKILKANQPFFLATKAQLENDGRTLTPPNFSRQGKPYDDVLFVEKSDKQSLWSHPLHQKGAFYVQEMAAGLPAQILNVQPGEIVLDLCAAPGGKSIQLADKKVGFLIANELNPVRRKALKANLERCGIRNTIVTGYDGRILGDLLSQQCDKVLIDAPCSGEGMQYKSDFKVYQRNERQAKKLAHTQYDLLLSGFKALKIWGELVYSTCTTNVIENEGVIMRALEELGDSVELMNVEIEEKSLGLGGCARFRPHLHHTGGFFIAKFKKIKSSTFPHHPNGASSTTEGIALRNTASPHGTAALRNTAAPLNKPVLCPPPQRGIINNGGHRPSQHCRPSQHPHLIFLQTKHTIRVVAKEATRFLDLLYIDQAGLPVFKILNNNQRKPLEWREKLAAQNM